MSNPQKRIAALRKRLKLGYAEFAEKLGVDRATAYRWETGRAKPGALAVAYMENWLKQLELDEKFEKLWTMKP